MFVIFILSTTTFAHVRTASEPEWDGYYSLTNQTVTKPFGEEQDCSMVLLNILMVNILNIGLD